MTSNTLEHLLKIGIIAAVVPLVVLSVASLYEKATKTRKRLSKAVTEAQADDAISVLFETYPPSRGIIISVAAALESIRDIKSIRFAEDNCNRAIELLQTYRNSADFRALSALLLIIHRTSFNNLKCKVRYGELHAPQLVLSIISALKDQDRSIALHGTGAIAHLAAWNENGNRDILIQLHACELVVDILGHAEATGDSLLALNACEAIRILNDHDHLMQANALVVLTKTLHMFGSNLSSLASESCAALNLLLQSDMTGERSHELEEHQRICNGITATLGAFGQSNICVVEEACPVVSLLCRDARNRERFGQLGMCETLVDILSHFTNEGLSAAWAVSRTCTAMKDLAESNENNTRLLGQYGACEVVVNVLRTFKDKQIPDIAPVACALVNVLVLNNESNKQAFIDLGVIEAVEATHEGNQLKYATLDQLQS